MDMMIFIKWLTPWEHTYEAPSIINLFMNMVLGLGSTKGTPLWKDVDQQELIQLVLLCKFFWGVCFFFFFFMDVANEASFNKNSQIKSRLQSTDYFNR